MFTKTPKKPQKKSFKKTTKHSKNQNRRNPKESKTQINQPNKAKKTTHPPKRQKPTQTRWTLTVTVEDKGLDGVDELIGVLEGLGGGSGGESGGHSGLRSGGGAPSEIQGRGWKGFGGEGWEIEIRGSCGEKVGKSRECRSAAVAAAAEHGFQVVRLSVNLQLGFSWVGFVLTWQFQWTLFLYPIHFFFLFKFFFFKLFLFLFTSMSFLGIDFTFESFIIKIINIMKENVRACLGTSLKTVF